MLALLREKYLDFRRALAEGHYSGHAHPADDLFRDAGDTETADQKAGNASFNLAIMVGGDVLLGAVAAATSLTFLGAAAAIIAVTGTAFYAREYLRCKKAAHETICETNFAGQHVEGERGALYRLHKAQARIVDLSVEFGNARASNLKGALDDEISRIVEKSSPDAAHVHVLDEGTHHAGKARYAFVRPSLHVVKHA